MSSSDATGTGLTRRGLFITFVLSVLVALSLHQGLKAIGGAAHAAARPPRIDREAVIRFYERKVASDPEDFRSLAVLANELITRAREAGDEQLYVRAEAAARESLRLQPTPRAPGWPVLARTLLARHDFDGAVKIARDALAPLDGMYRGEEKESAAELLAIVCDADIARGDVADAESAVAALSSIARTQYSLSRCAQVKVLRGRDDEALDLLEAACTCDSPFTPESSAWVRTLAGSIHAAHGRFPRARALHVEALEFVPDYWLAQLRLAELDALEDKLGEASARFERIASVNSVIYPAPQVLAARADVEARLGDREAAESHRARAEVGWRRSLQLGYTGHRRDFARHLLKRGSDRDVAEALELAQAEAKVRQDPETLETLGDAFLAAKRFAEACDAYSSALSSGYRRSRLLYMAGEARLSLGQRPEGLRLFREALRFGAGLDPELAHHATYEVSRP